MPSEGRIWEPVRHKGDSSAVVLRRAGVHVATT